MPNNEKVNSIKKLNSVLSLPVQVLDDLYSFRSFCDDTDLSAIISDLRSDMIGKILGYHKDHTHAAIERIEHFIRREMKLCF